MRETTQVYQETDHALGCALKDQDVNPWVIDADHPVIYVNVGPGVFRCLQMRCNDPDCPATVSIPGDVLAGVAARAKPLFAPV